MAKLLGEAFASVITAEVVSNLNSEDAMDVIGALSVGLFVVLHRLVAAVESRAHLLGALRGGETAGLNA